MSGKEKQYYEIRKAYLWIAIGLMLSIIVITHCRQELKVFDRKSAYLPMKKIGKNNPKAEQMEDDNLQRKRWNQTVDRALISGVPEGLLK